MPVQWCNLCQSRPADGSLEAQLFEGAPVERLEICLICLDEIPSESWVSNAEEGDDMRNII